MEQGEITIEKSARYTTFGNPETATHFWIALHGYGQLVKYFSHNFSHLDPDTHFIICPEGFNRFYLNGLSGRVGATWMTKEGRLEDISDYVKYLDKIYNDVLGQYLKPSSKKILFGFSQGVATASRWIAMGNSEFDIAIFWAGSFPPDLPPAEASKSFAQVETFCSVGTSDEFITPERLSEVKSHLTALKIEANWSTYEGGHNIPKDELSKLIDSITS